MTPPLIQTCGPPWKRPTCCPVLTTEISTPGAIARAEGTTRSDLDGSGRPGGSHPTHAEGSAMSPPKPTAAERIRRGSPIEQPAKAAASAGVLLSGSKMVTPTAPAGGPRCGGRGPSRRRGPCAGHEPPGRLWSTGGSLLCRRDGPPGPRPRGRPAPSGGRRPCSPPAAGPIPSPGQGVRVAGGHQGEHIVGEQGRLLGWGHALGAADAGQDQAHALNLGVGEVPRSAVTQGSQAAGRSGRISGKSERQVRGALAWGPSPSNPPDQDGANFIDGEWLGDVVVHPYG